MPTIKLWNHAIETKKGFALKKGKVYSLLRKERKEVHKFIQEQLRKRYIKLSKSSQMVPVFFVEKKNGKKKMVQDYYYLNKWTIKNNYPLPLILDIIKNINTKKVFIKLDLHWGYNNVQIKEDDEWKVVFVTLEELFEPTVMFFRLTNFLAMFQMIINEILWDLINTEKVVSFIDEIIVETKKKKGYDEIVEEVVKILAENDLYMKLEKCKWKV